MKKSLRKFFSAGGGARYFTLRYYSPDVDAVWTLDADPGESLQIIYERKNLPDTYDPETKGAKKTPDENFWLYLAPQDAAAIGAALVAWAKANGETA